MLCYKYQLDYVGPNIDVESGLTPHTCQVKCQEHANCKFFVFILDSNNCYLKNAADPKANQTPYLISGPKFCPDLTLNE